MKWEKMESYILFSFFILTDKKSRASIRINENYFFFRRRFSDQNFVIFWSKSRKNEAEYYRVFCNSAFSFTKLNRVILPSANISRATKYVAEMNLLLKLYYIGRWKFRINIICIHTVVFDISPENISKIVKVYAARKTEEKVTFYFSHFPFLMIHPIITLNFDLGAQSFIAIFEWPFALTFKWSRSSSKRRETLIPFIE